MLSKELRFIRSVPQEDFAWDTEFFLSSALLFIFIMDIMSELFLSIFASLLLILCLGGKKFDFFAFNAFDVRGFLSPSKLVFYTDLNSSKFLDFDLSMLPLDFKLASTLFFF